MSQTKIKEKALKAETRKKRDKKEQAVPPVESPIVPTTYQPFAPAGIGPEITDALKKAR